jgi:calcium/calmodulin-dependent protein kinase (CaM kinase) II
MDETSDSPVRELLELTQQLLDAIASDNWEVYLALCDPTLSAFEPEARGQLVEGTEFHHFYFRLTDK